MARVPNGRHNPAGDRPGRGWSQAVQTAATALSIVSRGLNAVGTLVVLGLVVAVNADVVGRNLFLAPIRGTVEIVQFSMVLIVFLQLPDVVRIDRLTRSDGFLAVLADRWPGLGRWLARVIDAASALFMGLVAGAVWPQFVDAWHGGDYLGTPGIFTAPEWPVKLAIVVAGALCCLIFLAKALAGNRRPEHLHLEDSGA